MGRYEGGDWEWRWGGEEGEEGRWGGEEEVEKGEGRWEEVGEGVEEEGVVEEKVGGVVGVVEGERESEDFFLEYRGEMREKIFEFFGGEEGGEREGGRAREGGGEEVEGEGGGEEVEGEKGGEEWVEGRERAGFWRENVIVVEEDEEVPGTRKREETEEREADRFRSKHIP